MAKTTFLSLPREIHRQIFNHLLPYTITVSSNASDFSTLLSLSLVSRSISPIARAILHERPIFLQQTNVDGFLRALVKDNVDGMGKNEMREMVKELDVNLSGFLDEKGDPQRGPSISWLESVLSVVHLHSCAIRGLTNVTFRPALDALASHKLIRLSLRAHTNASLNTAYLSRLRHFPSLLSLSLYGVNLPTILRSKEYVWEEGTEPTFRLRRLELEYCEIAPCLPGLLRSSLAPKEGEYTVGSLTTLLVKNHTSSIIAVLRTLLHIPSCRVVNIWISVSSRPVDLDYTLRQQLMMSGISNPPLGLNGDPELDRSLCALEGVRRLRFSVSAALARQPVPGSEPGILRLNTLEVLAKKGLEEVVLEMDESEHEWRMRGGKEDLAAKLSEWIKAGKLDGVRVRVVWK
ncbi:hypothetical protein BT69DRAFT_1280978 [Atractiella rhizophila]|nr:hypothetical protein BT69DRAFT_1280978 [Atractiella rhizophila]